MYYIYTYTYIYIYIRYYYYLLLLLLSQLDMIYMIINIYVMYVTLCKICISGIPEQGLALKPPQSALRMGGREVVGFGHQRRALPG